MKSPVFPTFTDHTLLHTLSVANISNQLLREKVDRLSAEEIYIYLLAGVSSYCSKYAFPPKSANRVQLVGEELLTCVQNCGRDDIMNITVAYEDATGRKEVILRDRVCSGNILESEKWTSSA